jgi:hypothetical protein
MRVWFSGPRLFRGLVRPGVSFNAIAAKADARTFSSLVTKILMDWLAGRK